MPAGGNPAVKVPSILAAGFVSLVQTQIESAGRAQRADIMKYDDVLQVYRSHAYALRRMLVCGSNEQRDAVLCSYFYVRPPPLHPVDKGWCVDG